MVWPVARSGVATLTMVHALLASIAALVSFIMLASIAALVSPDMLARSAKDLLEVQLRANNLLLNLSCLPRRSVTLLACIKTLMRVTEPASTCC